MNPGDNRPIDDPIAAQVPAPLTGVDGPLSAPTDTDHLSQGSSRQPGRRIRGSSLVRLRNQLSERDLAILQSVEQFRFLTSGQLRIIHFDGAHTSTSAAARSCGRILGRLTRLRLVNRLPRAVGGHQGGSAAGVFSLGPVGRRLLERNPRQGFKEPTLTFLHHCLAVADVFVAIVSASKADQFQLVDVETEPHCWRQLPTYGRSEILRPDLLVVLGRDELEFHWFLEIDLATEATPAIERKARQYYRYLQTGVEQARRGVFPRVAWLTTTPRRATQLAKTVAKAAGDVPLFEVGLLEHPLDVLVPAGGPS